MTLDGNEHFAGIGNYHCMVFVWVIGHSLPIEAFKGKAGPEEGSYWPPARVWGCIFLKVSMVLQGTQTETDCFGGCSDSFLETFDHLFGPWACLFILLFLLGGYSFSWWLSTWTQMSLCWSFQVDPF